MTRIVFRWLALVILGLAPAAAQDEGKLNVAQQDPLPRRHLQFHERGIDERALFYVAYGDMLFHSPLLLGEAARGLGLSCASCHSGGEANRQFFIPGLSSGPGSVDASSPMFNPAADNHRFDPFDIPSLRGIRFTAPYGRDGRIASLREFTRMVIVQEFAGPEPTPLMLDALVAFLNELDFLPAPFLNRDGTLDDRAPAAAKRGEALFNRPWQFLKSVPDLQFLARDAARALEPALECTAALLSPSTGIVDSHALMLALLGDAERHGAVLALQSPVQGGEVVADGIVLEVGGEAANAMHLQATTVVNCAGLGAQAVARGLRGLPVDTVPPLHYAKGNYYALAGRAPFSRLIYPVPVPAGLGVHLTLDLGGQARFGPDVEWIDRIDYTVAPQRADAFYAEVRRYWPQLPDGALQPAYAGIRPKPHAPDAAACDFLVSGPAEHGIRGLVCLYGIESPGLTVCLALADHIAAKLLG